MFRAKGLVWFHQQPQGRYIFHLSGKQRVECRQEGDWEVEGGRPGVQLVLIGTNKMELQQLQQKLMGCRASCCCYCYSNTSSGSSNSGSQTQHADAAPGDANGIEGQTAVAAAGGGGGECGSGGELSAAAPVAKVDFQRLQQVVGDHPWFLLWPPGAGGSADVDAKRNISNNNTNSSSSSGGGGSDESGGLGLLQFSAVGSAVHGIDATEVREGQGALGQW